MIDMNGLDVNALKDRVSAAIDGPLGDALIALSRDLHAHPEIRFEEVHAVETIARLLADRKIPAKIGVGGLPTAFEASRAHGNAGPTVAILAEYDALPGLGHACGHNVIAERTADVIATIARLAEKNDPQ